MKFYQIFIEELKKLRVEVQKKFFEYYKKLYLTIINQYK